MTLGRCIYVAVAAALLAACSKQVSDREFLCDDMPGLISDSPRATSAEQYELVEQCIHKWSARFALAPGPNSEIAKAAINRCSGGIADYYQLLAKDGQQPNEVTKEELDTKFADMALMRVVQQRAGQCSLKASE